MAEKPFTRARHPIVMLNYAPRVLGHFILCVALIITLMSQNRAITHPVIFFAALEGLVWPQVALYFSWNSSNAKRMEYWLLMVDSMVVCIWIPYVHYSFWPFFTVVMSTLLTTLCVGGVRLGLKSLLANMVGILIGSQIFGFYVDPHNSLMITITCAVIIIMFTSSVGLMIHHRALVTKSIYGRLKQANAEKDFLIHELKVSKDALEESLNALKRSKAQLVQSEKMAGVGQLVAGISHEINTPAGAIAAAIDEINADYVTLLKAMLDIIKSIPVELRAVYFTICSKTLDIPNEYNTMEVRNIASGIEALLKEHQVNDTRRVSKNLASVGFHAENIDEMLPLLQSDFKSEVCESVFMLGMTRIHTRDIKIAIDKILNLVKALKLFSRSDQEQITYTNLREDIETTLVILKNRLKHGITVIQEFDAIPDVECVAERLNQVWLNMINNAIEAMKGKGTIIIRIKQQDAQHVCVEFEDNGPGIPSEVLPRIFEAYYTTKPKGEGTGLGLYISDEIIKNHHGNIIIESSEKGTLFRIILPVKGMIKHE